jgi:hypothetical protein
MSPVTETSFEGANPRVAWIVIALVLALLLGEGAWLMSRVRANAALEQESGLLRENLARTRTRTEELRAGEARIKALYTRLNDAVVVRSRELPLLAPRPGQKASPEPPVIKAFRESGCQVAAKNLTELGNMSVTYVLVSHGTEFHRLVPFIAQQENSNTFLVVDKLVLERPATTPAFSEKPTALDCELSVRLLAQNQ